MKIRISALAAVLAVTAPVFSSASTSLLIEAEDFQLPANWLVEPSPKDTSGGKFMRSFGSDADALTLINVPAEGHYTLWVRARDYAKQDPGKRRYLLVIDNEPVAQEAGAHGQEGWLWQKVGERDLAKGDHMLGLRDTAKFYGRCDAILLTTASTDPNAAKLSSLRQNRVMPKRIEVTGTTSFPSAPKLRREPRRELGRLGNDEVRITFLAALDEEGRNVVVRETEILREGEWRKLPVAPEEQLFVLTARNSGIRSAYFPSWQEGSSASFEFVGQTYRTRTGRSPFEAGTAELLTPRKGTAAGAQAFEIAYETASGLKAKGRWELHPGHREVALAVTFEAPREGEYSIGFSPFQAWSDEETRFNLLSPMYQFQRRPSHANLMTDAVASHPMALVEVQPAGEKEPFICAAIAEPDALPFVWATPATARYGFSLLNARDQLQPTVFAPVLGLADSKMKAGETRTVRFRALAMRGDWQQALAWCSDKIFEVTDYRTPWGTSLTDAALNMIELMRDADHGGWDAKLKGFYNIEAESTAAQVSPLAVVSAALLTRDEQFYATRALPTIEFTLSRPVAHFALQPRDELGYVTPENTRLSVPSRFFGTSYWQGLHELLGRKNRWIRELALENGEPRVNTSYSAMARWSELLAQYRLSPEPALLTRIRAEADAFIEKEFHGRKTGQLGVQPFYNIHFYPYWWDLLDLFELTDDAKYLRAAEDGAFLTIAGQWSHPRTPPGDVTIHPGGTWPEKAHYWWKDNREFRLGWPLAAGALKEKNVPTWLVSPVGLSLEQPSTYFGGGTGGMGNILMSTWAPSLLRLYQHTGREIYSTYARNSIIGRFANYPGYYMRGFTDLNNDPQYPFAGPDLTSIYYHHIPPHLAFTLDYVVTEAEQRSGGRIKFPWVKQQGYCWFTNRIYGGAPGRINDETEMALWLDRQSLKVAPAGITYLAARNDRKFSLVLMNETRAPITPRVTLDPAQLGIERGSKVSVTVPARGLSVVSFDRVAHAAPPEIPVLETEPVQEQLAGDWGTLHAFRIRSPFGKDSLYAVLTGRPPAGARASLWIEGRETPIEAPSYPYEFSVYPWPMQRDLKFHVQLKSPDGVESASSPLTLPGTHAR